MHSLLNLSPTPLLRAARYKQHKCVRRTVYILFRFRLRTTKVKGSFNRQHIHADLLLPSNRREPGKISYILYLFGPIFLYSKMRQNSTVSFEMQNKESELRCEQLLQLGKEIDAGQGNGLQ